MHIATLPRARGISLTRAEALLIARLELGPDCRCSDADAIELVRWIAELPEEISELD